MALINNIILCWGAYLTRRQFLISRDRFLVMIPFVYKCLVKLIGVIHFYQ
jgi:hypothetical protein